MIRQTSILAYRQLEAEGTLGKEASIIYEFFKARFPFAYTRNDISRLLNKRINGVSGRINGLLKPQWNNISPLVELGKVRDPITKKQNMIIQWNENGVLRLMER